MENFEHLNQETKEIMYSSKEERLYYLEKNLFIDYPRTKELMDLLARMMNSPKKPRMQNLLLIGEPNIGKTSILNKFYEKYNTAELEDENGYSNSSIFKSKEDIYKWIDKLTSKIVMKFNEDEEQISDFIFYALNP